MMTALLTTLEYQRRVEVTQVGGIEVDNPDGDVLTDGLNSAQINTDQPHHIYTVAQSSRRTSQHILSCHEEIPLTKLALMLVNPRPCNTNGKKTLNACVGTLAQILNSITP